MSFSKYVLKHFKIKSDSSFETNSTELPAFDIRARTAIGDKRDTFQFKVLNPNDRFSTFFNVGDKIDIHLLVNSDATETSNLIMSGVLKTVTRNVDHAVEAISIEGVNYSEVVMNALIFLSRDSGNAMQLLEQMVNVMNLNNNSFNPNDLFNLTWAAGNPDGAGFPDLGTVTEFYKSANSLLERYLKPPFVPDGVRYYWFVDVNNELIVRARDNDITQIGGGDLSFQDGKSFFDFKIGADITEVKNFVVWKAGIDPAGKVIMGYQDNPVSRQKHGFKFHILLRENTSSDLFEREHTAKPDSFEIGSRLLTSSALAASYTTIFTSSLTDSENLPFVTKGSTVTITTQTEWIDAFRREVEFQAAQDAERFIDDYANGYLQVTGDIPLTINLQVGQLSTFTATRYGFTDKLLRIHALDFSRESLRVVMQEDEATL